VDALRKILLVLAVMLLIGNVAFAEKVVVDTDNKGLVTYIDTNTVRSIQVKHWDMAKGTIITEKNGNPYKKIVWYIDKDSKNYCMTYYESIDANGNKTVFNNPLITSNFIGYDNNSYVDKILELVQQKEGK
jgi:hypothetical protein